MICSDLDPMQAPQWAVRIIMTEDPNCLLGNFMVLFFFFFFLVPHWIKDFVWFKKKNKLHLYLVLWANFSTCTSRLSIPGYSCMTNKKNFFKNFWFEQNGSVYIWFNVSGRSGRSNFLMKIILQKILIKENLVFKIKAISFTPTHKYY